MKKQSLPAQPNQSLMHGIACLQAVVAAKEPVGSRALARQLGLEPTHVNRLLGTLCHIGMVERTAAKKYCPGARIHLLAAQSLHGSGLLAAALPVLRELRKRYDLLIALGVLWGAEVCYLVHAAPGCDVDASLGAHSTYSAHRSILGVALMSSSTDAEIRETYRDVSGSPSSEELENFLRWVQVTRKRGYASASMAPHQQSLAVCVGSPVIAAISLTGNEAAQDSLACLAALRDAAERIEKKLNARHIANNKVE